MKREKFVRDSIQAYRDSLSFVRDSLPNQRITIEYLEMGKSTAERLGFSYSEYIGSASFFDYDDLFSVSIQARDAGDTTYIYRTYTSVFDSTLRVFWGGSRDKIKTSNITSNGVVSNSYVTESYGLTFDVNGSKYSYTYATDYEHSISGQGKLLPGKNKIFGAYQRTYTSYSGIPFLRDIPVLGFLFRHSLDETEYRYVFISVTLGGVDGTSI